MKTHGGGSSTSEISLISLGPWPIAREADPTERSRAWPSTRSFAFSVVIANTFFGRATCRRAACSSTRASDICIRSASARRCQVELYDFDRAVDFKAMVVRVVEAGSPEAERFPMGFGVRIMEIDDANRTRLESSSSAPRRAKTRTERRYFGVDDARG